MCRLKRSEYFYFYPQQTKNWFELELLPRAKIFQIWAKSFLKKVLAGLKFSHFEVGLKNIRRLFKLINSGGFNTKVSSKLTKLIDNILFKWANPGLFLLIFVLFTFQFKWQIYNLNKLKKHRCCAWDSNPEPQDGMCRRIHWAMAAPQLTIFIGWISIDWSTKVECSYQLKELIDFKNFSNMG